jgi:hypothetical protein
MIHSEKATPLSEVYRIVVCPGVSACPKPVWVMVSTKGLLDVQVPLAPAKLVLISECTLPSLNQPTGVNCRRIPVETVFWFVLGMLPSPAVVFCGGRN